MLKYYSYYNVGGYKDMYLGDSSMNVDATYFLPLLQIWKKKAATGDVESTRKVAESENLRLIKLLNSTSNYGLPQEATTLFSHGGFKLICSCTSSGESILVVRDIVSASKDDSGRSIPFLIAIIGDTSADKQVIDKVAAYAASHIETFSTAVANSFAYDAEKNGLIFLLSQFTDYIYRISKEYNNTFFSLSGKVDVNTATEKTTIVLYPEGLTQDLVIKELQLPPQITTAIAIDTVLPLDNQKRLVSILHGLKSSEHTFVTNQRLAYLVGGAALLGFILGFLIGKP